MAADLSPSEAKTLIEQRVDFHGHAPERRAFDRQMLKNRAMFFGKQHFKEDRNGRLAELTNISPMKVLYRANFILGDVLRAMLTVTGARGEFTVPPNSGSKQDRHAAWVSTKLFEHMSYVNRMREKQRIASLYAAIDGSVIWKTSWNTKKGEPRRYYWSGSSPQSPVLLDPDEETRRAKEEAGEFDDVFTGDVEFEVGPLFQYQWDWNARETGWDAADWGVQLTLMKMSRIEELYGSELARHVRPEDPTDGALYYNEAISFIANAGGAVTVPTYVTDRQYEPMALHAEYWERANKGNRMQGRRIAYAGGAVLASGPNPYRITKHEIPLEKQDWITAPGRFIGISLVEQLTSPQVQYNASRANIIEHQKVFGHPAIFVPTDSGIPTGQYAVQPGMVYAKKASAGKVEFGPVPPTPEAALENAQMSRDEMANISSSQSLDGSKMPGQLRSGPALEVMFSERNKMLIEPAENFLGAQERVGRQALELASKLYPDEQVIQYVGEDKRFRVVSFRRADINANLRVMVDRERVLASPATEKARIVEAIQVGVLDPVNNPDDKEAVFKALEFGSAQELISDRIGEEELQEQEIEEMLADPTVWLEERADSRAPPQENPETGQMEPVRVRGYPINPWDDHRAHVKASVRFMRSPEFRALDEASKSVVEMHWQAHQSELDKAMMQQMMLQEALRGGGGEKGKPSQPKMQVA